MMNKFRLITAWLLLFSMQMAAQPQMKDADTKYATELLKAGTPAPDFQLKTPQGKKVKFSKLAKGKYVVIDFWASWCSDCRKDIPNIRRIYEKFHPLGVEFIGVSFDDNADNWKNAIEKYDIPYTQVSELKRMRDSEIASAYGIKWIPSMYLIDPEGKVMLSTVLSDKLERTMMERIAPKKAINAVKEHLTIDGGKGKLDAVIQKPQLEQGQKCPMVVLMHGFGGRKEGPMFDLIADSLSEHGIASIRFDFNGHGKSEGDFQHMTVPNEIQDAAKVIEYVRDLRYVDGIAVVGHSQGGVVAAMTAGELEEGDVDAVVLLAPAGVLREDAIRGSIMGRMSEGDPLDPPEYIEMWGGLKLGRDYILTSQRLPIYSTAARYHGPALVIHGTGDRVVPFSYGERFHEIWPGSEYDELEAFDHGFSQNIYRVCNRASKFLIEKLKAQREKP
ncbi:MAG: alpha/beta fold hydrolase [Prevotella sp.]|nr:alpha/beta fold hydrolase [Prevotella sp.]